MPREGYVREIRELIGTRPLLLPSVAVMVAHDDRLVVGRHVDTGHWVIPGGCLEPGERPADCAVREVFEETGLRISLVGLHGVFGGGEAHRVRYPNGDVCDYVVTIFDAEVSGDVTPAETTEELSGIKWVTPEELRALDTPPWLQAVMANPGGFEPPSTFTNP